MASVHFTRSPNELARVILDGCDELNAGDTVVSDADQDVIDIINYTLARHGGKSCDVIDARTGEPISAPQLFEDAKAKYTKQG